MSSTSTAPHQMEALAERAAELLRIPWQHDPRALEDFLELFDATFITQAPQAPAPELDAYPELFFPPPPSGFAPERLRVENRGLMNSLAVVRSAALPRLCKPPILRPSAALPQVVFPHEVLDGTATAKGTFPPPRVVLRVSLQKEQSLQNVTPETIDPGWA